MKMVWAPPAPAVIQPVGSPSWMSGSCIVTLQPKSWKGCP